MLNFLPFVTLCVTNAMAAVVPCVPTPFADLPMKDFNITKLAESGITWYEVGAFPSTTSDVSFSFSSVDGDLRAVEAERLPDTGECALYLYRCTDWRGVISSYQIEDPSYHSDVAVMATDYATYYFEYACYGLTDGVCDSYITSMWVSDPGRRVSNDLAARAERVFGKLCLNLSDLTMTGKTGWECDLE